VSDIYIEHIGNVYCKVNCDTGILQELVDHFTFFVPGYKYNPKFKSGFWDGKIRLLNYRTRVIYRGLHKAIQAFCEKSGYSYSQDPQFDETEFSLIEMDKAIKDLGIPEEYEDRDYQMKAVAYCIRNRAAVIVSPTASGKSLIIYMITRLLNKKTLVIVPTLNLIHQLFNDFKEYGYEVENHVHKLYQDQEAYTAKNITVSTWHTAVKMPKEWFDQFEVVIGDEAHNCKAKSLIHILTSLTNCPWRFGFTGSLNDDDSNRLVIEGLFGRVKQFVTTKQLIDAGTLSKLKIKAIVLKHPEEVRKVISKATYQDEIDWIINNNRRNVFIKNLVLSLDGNTLILSSRIEKHLLPLHAMVSKLTDRPVHLVHGGVDAEDREHVRNIVKTQNNAIIFASAQCFSEGVNIPSLKNIVFTTPTKSRIKIMQAIGRTLRYHKDKEEAVVFDIADDLSWKSKQNHTIKHYISRVSYYAQENFVYKQYNIDMK